MQKIRKRTEEPVLRICVANGQTEGRTDERADEQIDEKSLNICDALRDLVAFVQFKKREQHPWRSVNFSKVAGCLQLY